MVASTALQVVQEQIEAAIADAKCHPCACFQSTVSALEAAALDPSLQPLLDRAKVRFVPKRYDCLGCDPCFPAVAANAVAETLAERGETLEVCPTEAPRPRRGWPPLPGDYTVVRTRAAVAVCTLNSAELAARLASAAPDGVAIVGTLRTENLGIERIILNVLANPQIRSLVLCGEDTRREVGHLPGRSLSCLFEQGVDDSGRIRGAPGKRPVLRNVTSAQIETFVRQVALVDRVGVEDVGTLLEAIDDCRRRVPGPFGPAPDPVAVTPVQADEPRRLVADRAGYFVVYPDAARGLLAVEHYDNDGVLDCVIEGRTPAAVYSAAIERELLTRLDHAAYLGRELALAERSLATGERYVQDRAPGEAAEEDSCGPGCGCTHEGPPGARR